MVRLNVARRIRSRKVIIVALIAAVPAYGLWGIGDIVFDPTSYAQFANIWQEDVSTGIKLANTYNETLKIVKNGLQLYALEQQMAQRVESKNDWIMTSFALGNEYTQQHYNESVNMSGVMNGDYLNAAHGWNQATYNAGNGAYLGASTPATSTRMSEYASIQLIDQTSTRCATILAQYKASQDANAPAEKSLSDDAFSTANAKNYMTAVLNIMSGGSIHLNTQAKANGNLQACLAEQQTLASKIERDKLAAEQDWYAGVAAAKARTNTGLDPDKTLQVNRSYMVP